MLTTKVGVLRKHKILPGACLKKYVTHICITSQHDSISKTLARSTRPCANPQAQSSEAAFTNSGVLKRKKVKYMALPLFPGHALVEGSTSIGFLVETTVTAAAYAQAECVYPGGCCKLVAVIRDPYSTLSTLLYSSGNTTLTDSFRFDRSPCIFDIQRKTFPLKTRNTLSIRVLAAQVSSSS